MIIGIIGKAGSGKDTIADFLINDHGAAKVAFADPMKRFVQQTMGFTEEQLWGASEKRLEPHLSGQLVKTCSLCGWFGQDWPIDHDLGIQVGRCPRCGTMRAQEQPLTSRLALQTLGTDWGRALLPDVWARAGVNLAEAILAGEGAKYGARNLTARKPEVVVFSDVRFANEAAEIREAGGRVWRVERTTAKGAGGMGDSHPSEAEQDSIEADTTIRNNATLGELRGAVRFALTEKPELIDVEGGYAR